MEAINFDTLNYSRILQSAGIPQNQAEAFTDAQKAVMREVLAVQELATKEDVLLLRADLRETELRLQKEIEQLRAESKADFEQLRADLRETELRLQKEIEQVRGEIKGTEFRLLVWQLGIGLAIISIMAKGFGWLGF